MKPDMQIPILDISAIYSEDADRKLHLAKAFHTAYSTAGFSYIVNHQVPEQLIERVFNASELFHVLPLAEKMRVELNHLHRGFIPINTSTDVNSKLANVKHPNQSESFMVMREDSANSPQVLKGNYLAGANQWPELSGFKDDVMAYNNAMADLARKLIDIIALALRAREEFTESFDVPTTWLRLLHYPANNVSSAKELESKGVYGSAPHTDFGCLTLLAQDDVGGLQVQNKQRQWIDVPRLPGSFVVNAGDMLQRWSNNQLKSTPHRVINASGNTRYSCPFFFDPHVSTNITPLPSCVSAAHPPAYEPINFGEFLQRELQAGYQQHAKPGPAKR